MCIILGNTTRSKPIFFKLATCLLSFCMYLCTFNACSGEMFGSARSSFSMQRLSWDSSSNSPSIFSTSQANQTWISKRGNTSVSDENSECWTLQEHNQDRHLRAQRLALDEGRRGISCDPANQGGEQTPISMVTQGILCEAQIWERIFRTMFNQVENYGKRHFNGKAEKHIQINYGFIIFCVNWRYLTMS